MYAICSMSGRWRGTTKPTKFFLIPVVTPTGLFRSCRRCSHDSRSFEVPDPDSRFYATCLKKPGFHVESEGSSPRVVGEPWGLETLSCTGSWVAAFGVGFHCWRALCCKAAHQREFWALTCVQFYPSALEPMSLPAGSNTCKCGDSAGEYVEECDTCHQLRGLGMSRTRHSTCNLVHVLDVLNIWPPFDN